MKTTVQLCSQSPYCRACVHTLSYPYVSTHLNPPILAASSALLPFWSHHVQLLADVAPLPCPLATPILALLNGSKQTWFSARTTGCSSTATVQSNWPQLHQTCSLEGKLDISHCCEPVKVSDPIAAVKLQLYPLGTAHSTKALNWFGAVRWTYNQCVRLSRSTASTNLRYLRRKVVNSTSKTLRRFPHLEKVWYDSRDYSVKEFCTQLKTLKKRVRDSAITHFQLKYRSRKDKSESVYIRRRWIQLNSKQVSIRLSTKGEKLCFHCPELTQTRLGEVTLQQDCRLQRTRCGEYFLCIPQQYEPASSLGDVKEVESQDLPQPASTTVRVAALDPGIRTFQTVYDPQQGHFLEVAPGDIKRVFRLCKVMDQLVGRIDTTKRRDRWSLQRARAKLARRIQNLVQEVHRQLAKHLAQNYDLILLPNFDVSQMVGRAGRKLGKDSVRKMLTWSHYKFKQLLGMKCRQYGARVVLVSEAYTSKTCGSCGWMHPSLGGNKRFRCGWCRWEGDRDMNGARNILLRNGRELGLKMEKRTTT